MSLYRFNVTAPDNGPTLSIVARDTAQARAKAWHRLSAGVPFLHYGPDRLRVRKLEAVAGPALVTP